MKLNIVNDQFIKNNRTLLFLFLFWLLRLVFLKQGNAGGMAFNKYVILQILLELGIFFVLAVRGVKFFLILKAKTIRWFALLYLFGMVSGLWSVAPSISTYFAFQNFLMLNFLLYLFMQTRDHFETERCFLFATFVILMFFLVSCLFAGESFHSVIFSTIAGIVFLYSATEYDPVGRPPENLCLLRIGIWLGLGFLLLTTSSGAMVSVGVGTFFLAILAKRKSIRSSAWFLCVAAWLSYLFGATEWLMNIFLPGKSMLSVETAHGRTYVWDLIIEKALTRPWFGWGYASIERSLEDIYTIDTHNAAIGVFGNLGYVGCGIAIIAVLTFLYFVFINRKILGMAGVFVAMVAALVNSNTSNFIVGKEGLAPVVFQAVVVLSWVYYVQRNSGVNE